MGIKLHNQRWEGEKVAILALHKLCKTYFLERRFLRTEKLRLFLEIWNKITNSMCMSLILMEIESIITSMKLNCVVESKRWNVKA